MKKLFLGLISFYQKHLSFILKRIIFFPDSSCRFTPTCSQYAYEAISRYGIIKGARRVFWRLLRCHPFSLGGADPLK